MNVYRQTLGDLAQYHSQPYHYQYLLKQEALMRVCAKQAQDLFSKKSFSHEASMLSK
ncbi:MAG: hypothetical protein KBD23_05860 [Gammaproteobacteria bacterium]|nr:hypothetical protein [Gammaproteobacteria bacterium]